MTTKKAPPPQPVEAATASPKRRGGRPQNPPETLRAATILVRVSPVEYAALRAAAAVMAMTPAQWIREAALSRRLPSRPAAAIKQKEYAELARLAADLNQLARRANEGERVEVPNALLRKLSLEVRRLRLGLLGVGVERGELQIERESNSE